MRSFPIKIRLVYLSIVCAGIICVCLYRLSVDPVQTYKENIIRISREYIRAIAKQQLTNLDDAYNSAHTGYDLKKTLAVILDDLLRRVDNIESLLQNVTSSHESESDKKQDTTNDLSSFIVTLKPTRALKMQTNKREPIISHIDLINGEQEKCDIEADELASFPSCIEKMKWLREHWKTDTCYAELGVDGTECSFVRYLSEVENKCPLLESRRFIKPRAEINKDIHGLMQLIPCSVKHNSSCTFIRSRISRMWRDWLFGLDHYITAIQTWNNSAFESNCEEWDTVCVSAAWNSTHRPLGQPYFFDRPRLNILISPGFLAYSASYNHENYISHNGPLGELVQWTDLITGLFLLGHQVKVFVEPLEVMKLLGLKKGKVKPCQVEDNLFDLIYTDISGYRKLKYLGLRISDCKYRILDSFGTQAEFNRQNSAWGGLKLNLQQFYTFFPHSPDNTFLGFVVEQQQTDTKRVNSSPKSKKPMAVVLGKEVYMWARKEKYLQILSDYFDLHCNIAIGKNSELASSIPRFVQIHHEQYGHGYLNLLRQAQIMVGLGFPYESPAPLEAIANGLIFLNPSFHPPHGKSNQAFFKDKPTSRTLSSQNPYIEKFIGEPYSYLVNMQNETELRATINRVLKDLKPTNGYRSHEFSPWGFIERLNAYLTHQSMCIGPNGLGLIQASFPVQFRNRSDAFGFLDNPKATVIWPPVNNLQMIKAKVGQSCVEACQNSSVMNDNNVARFNESGYLNYRSQYMIKPSHADVYNNSLFCCPEHFHTVNNRLNLKYLGITCKEVVYINHPSAPFWDETKATCYLQADPKCFDCIAKGYKKDNQVSRICPCRNSLIGQIALCDNCV